MPSLDTNDARPVGVLLANLGSPDAPDAPAVRRYLDEFLSDPDVVDWPRWIWLPILRGIILRTRPERSASLYRRVWTDEGSPLIVVSARQAEALQERLGAGFVVRSGMRYGRPSLGAALDALGEAGCRRLVVLPAFPQGSRSTTGTLAKELTRLAAARPNLPPLTQVPAYPDDDGYLDALASALRRGIDEHAPEHVLLSFHGVPARWSRAGDPYQAHCERTALLLARRAGLADGGWTLVYQSRFGPERWLGPAADETVRALAARHRRLLVICPGFPADCLETIDEIGRELARTFVEAGGESLARVPGLNTDASWIDAMAALVRRQLDGESHDRSSAPTRSARP